VILRSILCPVDFSEQSRHALRLAGALAARYQSRLVVLSVVDPLLAEAARAGLKLDLAKTETLPALEAFVTATWPGEAVPAPHPVCEVRVGNSSDVILEVAARDAVALIVMGTQGLGGLRKWLVGSTTERVLRGTRTPVLAVPPISHVRNVAFDVDAILAATDFTDSSAVAVAVAAKFAKNVSVPLLLTHVVEAVTAPPEWSDIVEESNEARVSDAQARLKTLAEEFSGSQATEAIVMLGDPAEAIAALAAERGAGLIVMGLTGNQGPFARSPGSIAYRVLCVASVPVLIVPPSANANV
jgi:nucleotide-binding universal stress UspA family protein